MKVTQEKVEPKKTWIAPAVQVYGNVEKLTQQGKTKFFGDTDDFNVIPALSSV
jgi:hypothetical protein